MDIRTIPKVELHCHLEACFKPDTVREVGRTLGLEVPEDPEDFRREWLITEPVTNLENALSKFANIQSIWGSEEVIERLAYEACEYAVEQGIKIFELRYSPDFILKGHANLSFEKIHRAIVKGIERASALPLAVGVIGIVQKILPDSEAAYTADFIVDHKESFVGIDLADQDIGFEVRRFRPCIEKARAAGLNVTIHSGEDNVPHAPQHVRVAIEELGAQRIGHGVHILKDPDTVAFVKDRRVLLELCPTSNLLTSTVSTIREYPIRQFMNAGIPVSINSDDPGIFDIDLCYEYRLLAEFLGFAQEDFDRCNDVAAAYSFVPLEIKQQHWPREIAVIEHQ